MESSELLMGEGDLQTPLEASVAAIVGINSTLTPSSSSPTADDILDALVNPSGVDLVSAVVQICSSVKVKGPF